MPTLPVNVNPQCQSLTTNILHQSRNLVLQTFLNFFGFAKGENRYASESSDSNDDDGYETTRSMDTFVTAEYGEDVEGDEIVIQETIGNNDNPVVIEKTK